MSIGKQGRPRLFLDTNVFVDCLQQRERFFESARLLLIMGKVGEVELWMSATQMTDLIYILSEGGRKQLMPRVMASLRGLRGFVNVCGVGADEIDAILETDWQDAEDALIHNLACQMRADAIITSNKRGFQRSSIDVFDCDEFFQRMEEKRGTLYGIARLRS